MSTAIQTRPMEHESRTPVILTPAEMLSVAVEKGAGLEMVSKLMDLQERWEKSQARKAFDAAMADARRKIPAIKKNKHVGFDAKNGGARTDYMHETLDEIERTVVPILSEFGLSYRFRTEQNEANKVMVTCLIRHRDGHWEENALSASVDTTGNKNHLQAIASAVTYLQRYTLKAALGLSAANVDDDGQAAGGKGGHVISEEQFQTLRDLLTRKGGNVEGFLQLFKVECLPDLPAKDYDVAFRMLSAKKDKAQ